MAPDTIHWSLVDGARAPLVEADEFLSPAESGRLSSLRFPKRRSEWLLGRLTAKLMIHRLPAYQQFALNEIEIRNTPEGLPQIVLPDGEISDDSLSISHRDGLAFCAHAAGPHLKIGADLEKVEARPANFAEDYFTPAEQALLASQPPDARDLITTLIWSTKEAMLKALGVGLRWDTRKVEVTGIDTPDSESEGWRPLQVSVRSEVHQWTAWWQLRGDKLLTLAGYSTVPVDWRIEEIKLQPV